MILQKIYNNSSRKFRYSGSGGIVHIGTPLEIGSELAIFTKEGCKRIHNYAFKLAEKEKSI